MSDACEAEGALRLVRNELIARLLAMLGVFMMLPDIGATIQVLLVQIRAAEPTLPLPIVTWTTGVAVVLMASAVALHVKNRKTLGERS